MTTVCATSLERRSQTPGMVPATYSIADLESRQADLAARVNAAAGGDYQELLRLTAELERVGGELETAVERWAELAEIAEGA